LRSRATRSPRSSIRSSRRWPFRDDRSHKSSACLLSSHSASPDSLSGSGRWGSYACRRRPALC
jgi:hypothetical protein